MADSNSSNNSNNASLKGKLSSAISRVKQAAALKLPTTPRERSGSSSRQRSKSVSSPTADSSNNGSTTSSSSNSPNETSRKSSRTKRLLKALTPRAKRTQSKIENSPAFYTPRGINPDNTTTTSDISSIIDDIHTSVPSSITRLQEMKKEEMQMKKSHTEPNGLRMITKKVSQASIKRKGKHQIHHLTAVSSDARAISPTTEILSEAMDLANTPYVQTEKDNTSYRDADDPTYTDTSKTEYDTESESERTLDDFTAPREEKKIVNSFVPSLSLASAQQIQSELVSVLDDSGSSGSSSSLGSRTAKLTEDLSTEQLIHQYASLNKAEKLRDLLNKERDRLRRDEDDDLALKTLFSDIVNCVDTRDQSTALHKAAAKNNCEVLELLLKEYKETRIDARDNLESTALHWACSNAALEAIFILCKFGASINVRDKYGYGPLHLTIKKKCYRGADVLLLYNGDINFKMSNGSTALHWACENNEMEIIKWLLTKDKINYNCRDKLKETPILRAATKGNMEIVEYLMKKNLVDWKMRDDKLQSLLHKAAYNGSNDLIMRIANINPVACNGMMNEKDRDGNTPLHLAVKKDHFRAIKSLCMMGAEMNIQNKHGDTPLHIAIVLKDYKTARYLYQSGASADLKNKKGLTARLLTETQKPDAASSKTNDSFKKNDDPSKVFL